MNNGLERDLSICPYLGKRSFLSVFFLSVESVRGNGVNVNFDTDKEPQECDYRLILAARTLNPRRLICRISR